MALRIKKALGMSMDTLPRMLASYDIHARQQRVDIDNRLRLRWLSRREARRRTRRDGFAPTSGHAIRWDDPSRASGIPALPRS
jgi:hypothetical protein